MLHPYSIFFKAMWEDPDPRRRPADDETPRRTRRFRWRLWWRDTARRPTAATARRADVDPAAVDTHTTPNLQRKGVAS